MALDSNTIIVKSDTKKELSDIMEFISRKGKENNMEEFLRLASENRKRVKNYKFIRWECYDR
ncbi:MAG: hypothetical protein LBK25_00380 [Treponema sp.]|nr:hypothetical protein [Treponema sp.]